MNTTNKIEPFQKYFRLPSIRLLVWKKIALDLKNLVINAVKHDFLIIISDSWTSLELIIY